MNRFQVVFSFALGVLLWTSSATALSPLYVIAIGNNAVPTAPSAGVSTEAALRYADDDASAMYRFAAGLGSTATLLTRMDVDTRRRFPALAAIARPPTLAALRLEVLKLKQRTLEDLRAKRQPTVILFYSGHGVRPEGHAPALTLSDGLLTRDVLYDEVLAAFGGSYVHVFIDACYAEAVVRPRDAEAKVVDLSPADIGFAQLSTLSRFPRVGALLASSSRAKTHEWDVYQQGVFTHQLLSGLRGGADVNQDDKTEYSELYAFLAAANRGVTDPRARLQVVARAPTENARAPIIDFGATKTLARLTGLSASAGRIYVEDGAGNRLADVHLENGGTATLVLPANEPLYLYSELGEATVVLRPGSRYPFQSVTFAAAQMRSRGTIDLAMQNGLFATPFGAGYYRGFIDQTPEFAGVPFAPTRTARATPPELDDAGGRAAGGAERSSRHNRSLFAGSGLTRGVGEDIDALFGLRVGLRPAQRSGLALSADAAWGRGNSYGEWRALGSIGYLIDVAGGASEAFATLGAQVGLGVAGQDSGAASASWTFAGAVTPLLATGYWLTPELALSGEAEVSAIGYQRDGRSVVSLFPAAYLGLLVSP